MSDGISSSVSEFVWGRDQRWGPGLEITGEDRSGVLCSNSGTGRRVLSADLAEELICFEPVLIFMRYI